MTTALAFDLFTDLQLLDNDTPNTYDITMLPVVVGDENSEIKIKNHKLENEKRENGFSKIKMFNQKDSFLGNQNSEIEMYKNDFSENEKRQIKKDLMKGYMRLLSN